MKAVGRKIEFSSWLQSEINQRHWSQADLARYADLNRAVINKLLNGKTSPQPSTIEAIARAFRIPLESAYRAAGLLPEIPEGDGFLEEVAHIFRRFQNPQRRATALTLLKALAIEDEEEQRTGKLGK